MAAPDWIEEAVTGVLEDEEEISDATELEDGKLAVVSTSKRGFVVRDRMLRSPEVWSFELAVPAGSENGRGNGAKTTTEPLPEAVGTDDGESEEPTRGPTTSEETDLLGPGAPEELTRISGIGDARKGSLAEAGIETFADLRKAEPDELADALRVSPETVTKWQQAADLTQVKGIGPARSERLEELGILCVRDLVAADPEELAEQLSVSKGTVEGWQTDAQAD